MGVTFQIIPITIESLMVIIAVIFTYGLTRRGSMYDLKRDAMLRLHESRTLYTNGGENAVLQLL